ncbi:DNA-directed RNA polymerase subunit omega [Ruminococcus flavefaciens]|uniref:DNA-directed RNA polymerase subunit omega n=1 Tax=Ruminococcus flavefaciens 007c TaxID=1341157 RepID=W7ULJ9_RUMFL|nr:DNA-directed RNA polymerase subunit omega [Ruminococcus flavefaciens]EWM54633.1 DNA-directed RNA polymerase subunit omega [Ruminococcus flavefaciens 007c]
MLRPAVNQIITKNESCYSLVIAVAKRARQISEDLYQNGETLEEKPVKTAVEELASGKCKIVSTVPQNAE